MSCCVKMLEESLNRSTPSSEGGSINESMITVTGEHTQIMDVSGKWIRMRGTLTCKLGYGAREGQDIVTQAGPEQFGNVFDEIALI